MKPDQKRRRRYNKKMNQNKQELMLFGAPESRFHYLCQDQIVTSNENHSGWTQQSTDCLSVCLSISDKRLFDLSSNQNQKPIEKSLHVWLPELFLKASFCFKNILFFTFRQEIITLTCPIRRGDISPQLNT